MTRNPFGIKIEINMSSGTNYVDNIMSYSPNTDNLLGSHNFYPHRYSGLGYEHFVFCSEKFRKYNLNTMAFVNSQSAEFGLGLRKMACARWKTTEILKLRHK